MAKFANHFNYISRVRNELLLAGTTGIGQHDLNQKTRTKIFQRDDMMAILLEWKARGWVQSFKIKGMSKHPKTYWRATTKLRDEWAMYNNPAEDEPGRVWFPSISVDDL